MDSATKRRSRPSEDRPRFLADVMLGSLARWLRILGFDADYDNRIADEEIVRRCVEEDRIALTRDRLLVKRRRLKRYVLVRSEFLGRQIREVLEATGLEVVPELLLSRCLECNCELRIAPREEVRRIVPPYVYRTQRQFKRCSSCGRVFWAGTHRERILQRLRSFDAPSVKSQSG